MNQEADYLSKCSNSEDWSIQDWVFEMLDKKWGSHTVDRFASQVTAKCIRFNSKWWVPKTEGINAFDQRWRFENNWFVPPPRLVAKCLYEMEADKAVSTLIVPEWKSAMYWPMLVVQQGSFKSFVREFIILPQNNLISSGDCKRGLFAEEALKFKMIAFRIQFK